MRPTVMCFVLLLTTHSMAIAQQGNLYDGVTNPYLLLLREPAVWDDLKLSDKQREQLQDVHSRIDGPFLALRNLPNEEATKRFQSLVAETKADTSRFLSQDQQLRLQQLTVRVRGIRCILDEQLATAMSLSKEQQTSLQSIIEATQSGIADLREQVQAGKPREPLEKEYTRLQTDEQKKILAELTTKQREQLTKLVGRSFDVAKLGHVSFHAPELIPGGEWINSPSLTLSQLRGQVVAVHFWTFGCINCIHNYPWYRGWQDSFGKRGLTIIGIHTPEGSGEFDLRQVQKKAAEAEFTFPILTDNDKGNWNAWGNSMWPSVYLVDKQGRVRHWWYGELNWQGQEGEKFLRGKIEELLAEPAPK